MKKELKVDVWDWVVTKDDKIRQITHDDMMDLPYEDIKRKANKKEIEEHKKNTNKFRKKLKRKIIIAANLISKEARTGKAYRINGELI